MIKRLAIGVAALLALSGCTTYDYVGGGSGYYHGNGGGTRVYGGSSYGYGDYGYGSYGDYGY